MEGKTMTVITITTTVDQVLHEDCKKRGLKWADLIQVGYQAVTEQGEEIISWRGTNKVGDLKRRINFFTSKTAEMQRNMREKENELTELKKRLNTLERRR
jgi:hypothetical protein